MKPVLFQWGPFTLYSYGLMMAVGFLFFLAYVRRQARAHDLNPEVLTNAAFAALLGGIVGARTLFVALDWEFFARNPAEVFLLNRGGLVWYGGFAGGVLAAYMYLRYRRENVARAFDVFVPPLAMAQAVGRIGCFLNGCCYGFEAQPPVGICLAGGTGCRFPVQLLNTALLLALFLFLHRELEKSRRPGGLIWRYGAGYGLLRFTTEFFRGDQTPLALGFSLPQWMSLALVAVSLAALALRRSRREPADG